MIGRTLSHYEITGKLGAGGMGEVYLAEDLKLERKVALKVLPAELADDPLRLKRLQREAKALAALDHPNIVSIYSIEEADGLHFLTMAYVEGQTLDELILGVGLGPGRLLELAIQLVDALRSAHAQGIVHRDLKPANIMVDSEGRLRVLDFGIARKQLGASEIEASQLPTQTMTELGTVLGTYPYMSPEQVEGRRADSRSDLFSLGVVLYQMASGHRPFQGDTAASLISSILKDTPRPLSDHSDEVPEVLERIVQRCLEKSPQDRYQSAEELRSDLAALQGEMTTGRVQTPATRETARVARSRLRTALFGVLVVVSVLAGVWIWRGRATLSGEGASPKISSIAVLPLQNRTGDPEQEYFVDGMTEALITDLSKISALRVSSRSASMRYKGTETPLPEIARELDVEAFVEGQVLREGDEVGIRAQLIEAATERNLWAETYSREMTSVLALQSEIAQAIAGQIQVTLTPEERSLLATERTVDPEAYEAYLKGVSHWNELTPADLDTALAYFELALERDPKYAPAYAGTANVWLGRQQMGMAPTSIALPAAKEAAARAVELDSDLPEAHSTLAMVHAWGEWDWDAAVAEFERALELKPNDPQTLAYFSHVLIYLEREEEALARAEKALELDPFNPLIRSLYGVLLGFLGRNEAALEQFDEALRIVPNHPVALDGKWPTLAVLERMDEAYEAARARFETTGEMEIVDAMDRGFAEGGYQGAMAAAADVLDRRPRERYFPALMAVAIYGGAGRIDGIPKWLERGLAVRDPSLPYLSVGNEWALLRGVPAYEEVLEELGLGSDRP